jgi:hypothetical protein
LSLDRTLMIYPLACVNKIIHTYAYNVNFYGSLNDLFVNG